MNQHNHSPSRRRFGRQLAAAGLSVSLSPILSGAARAEGRTGIGSDPEAGAPLRHLILIELQGGNDGLNTLVPYADPIYRALRPRLALDRDAIVPLDERIGLHGGLAPLLPLWDRGHLSIVQGVGYPDPNRSHFRSIEIWETASDDQDAPLDGWLAPIARTLAARDAGTVKAVAFADDEGPLAGAVGSSIVLDNMERFVKRAGRFADRERIDANSTLAHVLSVERTARQAALDFSRALEDHAPSRESARNVPPLARQLETVCRLIAADVGPQVWKVKLGGFDTHVNQLSHHAGLMGQLGAGIAGCARMLGDAGRWNDVVVMTYSEFGRRVAENASHGTDHGTAAPHLLAGGSLKGGLHGAPIDLARLEAQDLRFTTDFRSLYRTIATDWFDHGLAHAPYAGFERLRLFA